MIKVVVAVLILAASLASCGEPDVAAPPQDAPDTAPDVMPTPEPLIIAVTVRGGEVVGGMRRERVPLGADVTLIVHSDVTDEVHVHGFDHFADVEAGGRAELTFVADAPGIFVVELEDRGLHILELEIR